MFGQHTAAKEASECANNKWSVNWVQFEANNS